MRLTDFAYSFLTGQWKLDRMRTREFIALEQVRQDRMRLYAGANPGLNRPTPAVLSTPEDFKQAYERIVMIRAARQLEEDFPFIDGILSDFETFVIGDMTYFPNTGNSDADKLIREFLEWQFDQIDYSQRLDLTTIARLALRTKKRDGECGFQIIDVGDTLKLSYYSADRIGNPLVGANIGPSNYNGIIVDETTGAPVFFDLYKRLPKLNAYVFQQRIPANFFIHFYDPFRFEQYHGVTTFKNAIAHAYDIDQIINFTKLNIKYRSSQLPFIQNEQGRPRGSGYETTPATTQGQPQPMSVDIDGVTQTFMKIGEQVVEFPHDFPNQQFLPVVSELKRDIALGSKLPFEFVFRSETGGVVQRFYVSKAERTFDEEKRQVKRVILNPLKNRLIQKGIDTGFLDLDGFADLKNNLARFRGSWNLGRSISVDYGRETTADIALIDAGLMSPDEHAADNGRNLDDIRASIVKNARSVLVDAKKIAQDLAVPIEVVLPFLVKKFPNQKGGGGTGGGEGEPAGAPAGAGGE
ncbi:MAG: phage portal protein [Candidatus Omnitrophica bacterium]|nr:phage portal protein [Candidatus Omnitrophota bacterium]